MYRPGCLVLPSVDLVLVERPAVRGFEHATGVISSFLGPSSVRSLLQRGVRLRVAAVAGEDLAIKLFFSRGENMYMVFEQLPAVRSSLPSLAVLSIT
jgi:hypothetical protein